MNTELEFTNWKRWGNRNDFQNMRFPGVYAIAETDDELSNRSFSLIADITYFGMTNSKGGINSRLNQFENSILDKQKPAGHGGADRLKYKRGKYDSIVKKLYVSIWPIECDVKSGEADDLRKMGRVAYLEYECFARFQEKHGHLPEFNDHKISPKKYSRHGYENNY